MAQTKQKEDVMRVLIVDDSQILQERLLGLIEGCKKVVNIKQAFNTLEAKEILKEDGINIIISDIRMPGGGGFDLLDYVKKNYKNIKVIIITNYPYPQYEQKALELGAEYFLSKAEGLDNLLPILNEITLPNTN